MGRSRTQALDDLFADIQPHRRAAFFRRAFKLADVAVKRALADPEMKPRNQSEIAATSTKAVETLANIAQRATQDQEAQVKLAKAIAEQANATGEGKSIIIEVVPPATPRKPPSDA